MKTQADSKTTRGPGYLCAPTSGANPAETESKPAAAGAGEKMRGTP
jgi:hypothetical protein